MSKASDWAKRKRKMRFRERMVAADIKRKATPFEAIVGDGGELVFDSYDDGESMRLYPSEAARFARWILDTFGDTP